MGDIVNQVNAFLRKFVGEKTEDTLKNNELFKKATEMTKLPVLVLLGLGGLILTLLVWMVVGSQAVGNLVGFVYPAFETLKAVRSKTKDDDVIWLQYWVVYGTLTTMEGVSFSLLDAFIPFYAYIRIALIVCLFWRFPQLDGQNGASFVFDKVLNPYVLDKIMPAEDAARQEGESGQSGAKNDPSDI